METSSLKVKISVESLIYDALEELAAGAIKEHGILIRGVRFDWIDVSTPIETKYILRHIDMEATAGGTIQAKPTAYPPESAGCPDQ